MPDNPRTQDQLGSQRWIAFVRNRAKAILACDFFVTATASFRIWLLDLLAEKQRSHG
jgi:hypothetical protein